MGETRVSAAAPSARRRLLTNLLVAHMSLTTVVGPVFEPCLKLLVFFSRTSRAAVLPKFRGFSPESSLQNFQVRGWAVVCPSLTYCLLVFRVSDHVWWTGQWSILNNLPPSADSRPGKWEIAVESDLRHFVMENAMTLEVRSGYASSLMLNTSAFLNTVSHRLIKYLLVPHSFSCTSDVQMIRFVVRVVLPNHSVDSFVQLLKKVSVLERERSLITGGELNPDLLFKEALNWPSVTTAVNEIDTRPLQSLDHLYRLCSIYEICIDFGRYFPISEMTLVMQSILSAGLQSQVTIPAHSIYLRGVHFRPESLVFAN